MYTIYVKTLFIFLFYYSNVVEALIGENVRDALENEFPFVVSIATLYNDDRPVETTHRCTGTLIGPQDIITAQHCLSTVEATGFRMLIGSHDLRASQTFFCMFWWGYNYWATQRNITTEFRQNDMAYIKFWGDVPANARYASIPDIENNALYGIDVVTASWGVTNSGETSRILKAVDLKIISNRNCGRRLTALAGYRLRVQQRRLCTIANPFALVQSGDSGGPLMLENFIIAVNSGTCPQMEGLPYHPNQVNLHFGVNYYRAFILDMRHNTQNHYVQQMQ